MDRNFGGKVNFFCQFPGSANYALSSKVEASNQYDNDRGPGNANDNNWIEHVYDISPDFYESKISESMLLLTLPEKIALKMVVLQPRGNKLAYRLKLPRVLMSEERPGELWIKTPLL